MPRHAYTPAATTTTPPPSNAPRNVSLRYPFFLAGSTSPMVDLPWGPASLGHNDAGLCIWPCQISSKPTRNQPLCHRASAQYVQAADDFTRSSVMPRLIK